MDLLTWWVAALIQLSGRPLAAGQASGGTWVPLERASGGDTPVLRLSSADGEMRLLLDTGASTTLVTPSLTRRLGLRGRPLPAGAFDLAGGGKDCAGLRPQAIRLPTLELRGVTGTVRFQGIEALELPVGALPPGVDGVLGAPTLRLLPVLVDPASGRLAMGAPALEPRGAADQLRPRGRVLPLQWRRDVPVLRLAGSGPGGGPAALVDTGAEGLFVSPALAARLKPAGEPQPLRLVGFCGEQPVVLRRMRGLALPGGSGAGEGGAAGGEAGSQEVIVTANPIFQALGVEAIVGQELLRQRVQLWRLDLPVPHLELW